MSLETSMEGSSMNVGQKRAAVACAFCRQRKRKCDGDTPQCMNCRSKGLECIYQELTTQKYVFYLSFGDSDSTLVEEGKKTFINSTIRNSEQNSSEAQLLRLEAIEALLREHSAALEALKLSLGSYTTTPTPALGSDHLDVHSSRVAKRFNLQTPVSTFSTRVLNDFTSRSSQVDVDDVPPLTIPLHHQTSASSLLALPQMRCLAGEFPEEFFFQVEDSRPRSVPLQSTITWGELEPQLTFIDRTQADGYLERFFTLVQQFHPFFDRSNLVARHDEIRSGGFQFNNESALFLAIFALGAIASDPVDHGRDSYSGDVFIRSSLKIVLSSWTATFSGDAVLSQTLVLCALYFTYTAEPLAAWRFIHMASTSIQQILIRCKDLTSNEVEIQDITRLSWTCYIIESDILAEFHQPRSGIELAVDKMLFPNYGNSPTLENLYSLAEIRGRSLLNRIHHTVYFTDSLTLYVGQVPNTSSSNLSPRPIPDASFLRVCEELDCQLETWYDSLPDPIKPDLLGNLQGNKQACLLRLRYWSAKQNIYRPFVIYVTSQTPGHDIDVPQTVLERCQKCLSACRTFLLTAGYILSERTPYTYSTAQCSLASVLVLSIAARSSALRNLVDDIEMLQNLTIELLKPWACPGSSVECALEIVGSISRKQRFRNQLQH
ncbi:hypothetical protein B7463_g4371, partial [Scytalidium lignicola]